MYAFAVDDVNQALQFAIEHLLNQGVVETSRNGTVLVAPGPVCVEYICPQNRVLFSPTRDANPIFHLMESLWMLAGENDIDFPNFFNSTYGQFSDDGKTMWDAYGWRWRKFFGYDQLEAIIAELQANPHSRRCVLSMWNASTHHIETGSEALTWTNKKGETFYDDLSVACNGGAAVPCNTHAYFAIRAGKLNMTVMNRSNDAIWGAFGANAVHFSFLLEYMAMRIGLPMGSYYQFTNNLHIYTDKFSREKLDKTVYDCEVMASLPGNGPVLELGFDDDLELFMGWALNIIRTWSPGNVPPNNDIPALITPFMQDVAVPMFLFWAYRKCKDEYSSNICLDGIDAPDWQRACREWKERRETAKVPA